MWRDPSRGRGAAGRAAAVLTLTAVWLLLTAGVSWAQGPEPPAYRSFPFIGSRVALWIAAEVHLMFAAFVLGVPMFAVIVEWIGARTGDLKYDRLAREFTKLLLVAFSTTATFGAVFTFILVIFYPRFFDFMATIFGPTFIWYVLLFFGEGFALYLYWYSWDALMARKGLHLTLGVLLNVFGTALMFIANAWLTFMISPAGIDQQGQLTNLWAAVNNPTWMPINIHRLIANMAFGGTIVGAYAAAKFLGATTREERAHYDWMGYVGNFIAVMALIPLPFAGYWLGREIYAFDQSMGITMMGGFLSWLWIIQALLIGVLFLTANYYLWVGMDRIEGAERYRRFILPLLLVLAAGFLVWATPHSLVASLEEARRVGTTFHPLLGILGVMSAKNTAVNLMILTTFVSFMLYRRANKGDPQPFAEHGRYGRIYLAVVAGLAALVFLLLLPGILRRGLTMPALLLVGLLLLVLAAAWLTRRDRGRLGQGLVVAGAAAIVLWLGLYGYSDFLGLYGRAGEATPAVARIGFSIYQVSAVLLAMIFVTALDVVLFRNAPVVGGVRWGEMPARSQYALVVLAVTFTWLMGLMGYARNGIRQDWHVWGVLRDASPEAFSPALGFVAIVISITVVIFLGLVAFIFWIGELGARGYQPARLQPIYGAQGDVPAPAPQRPSPPGRSGNP